MNDRARAEAIDILVKQAQSSAIRAACSICKPLKGLFSAAPAAKQQAQKLMFLGQQKNRALAAWEKHLDAAMKSRDELSAHLESASKSKDPGGWMLRNARSKFMHAPDQMYEGPLAADNGIRRWIDWRRVSGYPAEYPAGFRDVYHKHMRNISQLEEDSAKIRRALSIDEPTKGPITSFEALMNELRSHPVYPTGRINWNNVAKWKRRM